MVSPSIVWHRLDLRIADNPAVEAAVARGGGVIPVFIYAPEEEAPWPPGAASRWWLHQSLRALDENLRAAGSRLIIRQGRSLATLQGLAKETGAKAVFWNRRYEPIVIARDAKVSKALAGSGLLVETFNAALLREPWTIRNQSGRPFQVFTPFWRHYLAGAAPAEPVPASKFFCAPAKWPKSLSLDELKLEPKVNWAGGLRAVWRPGEAGAHTNLECFVSRALASYTNRRNRPDLAGTSRLSPHLHFGEISPRQIWHRLKEMAAECGRAASPWRESQFLAEIGWREFAHHVLFHFPHTPTEPLRSEFGKFPWRKKPAWLRAWQKGETGYPVIDSGMRELWTTGWMHNRVRMIVASFLVKDLLISWQEGARWFWDTLVDADLAQNVLNWQWVAGCGADAAPFFRIFNPRSQGQKFDPHGDYIRRWCPELAKLPLGWIHQPHRAPPDILERAGLRLGLNYPEPLVSHAIAREVALERFAKIRAISRPRAGGSKWFE
jgi:deoxyribodipyrimidine photo-lyase